MSEKGKRRYTPATGGPKQTAWIRERVAGELMERSESASKDSDECFAQYGLERGRDIDKQRKAQE